MTTNITETLPWTDYREVFAKSEAKGRVEGRAEGIAEGRAEGIAEGRAEGRAERDKEIVKALYTQHKPDTDYSSIIEVMKVLGISDETIEAAQKQYEAEHPNARN